MGIHFKDVSYRYDSKDITSYQAINNINLSIKPKGELIALVGQTGSGKSTLAMHMNALLFPTEGEINIFGSSIKQKRNKKIDYNSLRKHVGLVFQFPEYQLFEETVEKDIIFGPLNFKVPLEEAKALAKKAIYQVGLDESFLTRSPFNLSGGEKKRVSIAGILAIEPDILVLDEPTSGLDPQGKAKLMELFVKIQKETEKTIIIITHDMNLVYQYASRVLVLHQGNLVFDESPEVLFKRDNLADYHLDYPETINILTMIKERLNLEIDIYQKDINCAYNELMRVLKK